MRAFCPAWHRHLNLQLAPPTALTFASLARSITPRALAACAFALSLSLSALIMNTRACRSASSLASSPALQGTSRCCCLLAPPKQQQQQPDGDDVRSGRAMSGAASSCCELAPDRLPSSLLPEAIEHSLDERERAATST